MKSAIIITFLLFICSAYGQYTGPVAPITEGYGANGPHEVSRVNIVNDYWPLRKISVFYPTGTVSAIPTIFYSHGYLSSDTTYHIETLHHIASQGYAVVFVPYKAVGTTLEERYSTLFDGFVKSARTLTAIIDTTKVGFFGQSFGGGATPRIAYRAFTENNWGANGKFIYCSAPWYALELGDDNLADFPEDCNMLTVLYDDDETNDHRMAMDVFHNIAINDSIKDCLFVKSDLIDGYEYQADHTLPSQYVESGEFDALDYYVTFRLIDALSDYTFNESETGKNMALGNGSSSQVSMGGMLSNLTSTNVPSPIYPESKYTFPCNDDQNERIDFCLSLSTEEAVESLSVSIYPNPTNGILNIALKSNENYTLSFFNLSGKLLLEAINPSTINLTHFSKGIYFVKIETESNSNTIRIEKQ